MKIKAFSREIDATKREEILDAATEEFALVGYKEATIRKICKSAKANVCLVSYYFGGKDGLYKSIFERVLTNAGRNFEDVHTLDKEIQTKEELRRRLQMYFERIYFDVTKNKNFIRLMYREIADNHTQVADILKEFMALKQPIIELVAYGQKKKFVPKDLEPALLVEAMMQLIVGFGHQMALNRPDLFFRGIPNKDLNEKIWKIITTVFFEGVIS